MKDKKTYSIYFISDLVSRKLVMDLTEKQLKLILELSANLNDENNYDEHGLSMYIYSYDKNKRRYAEKYQENKTKTDLMQFLMKRPATTVKNLYKLQELFELENEELQLISLGIAPKEILKTNGCEKKITENGFTYFEKGIFRIYYWENDTENMMWLLRLPTEEEIRSGVNTAALN